MVEAFAPIARRTKGAMLSISPECANEERRRAIRGKGTYSDEKLEELLGLCETERIHFGVFFMLGLPGQDPAELHKGFHPISSISKSHFDWLN